MQVTASTVNTVGAVTWTVEPEGVAEVDAYGAVTGIGEGETVVTASASGRNGESVTASVQVTVTEAPTMKLNRTAWTINPQLSQSSGNGACYLNTVNTGFLDDAAAVWRLEPEAGPCVLYPEINAGDTPPPETANYYSLEGYRTPFVTPTKIRWLWDPEHYGTDPSSLEYPLIQRAVLTVKTGGAELVATCDITILDPNGA